MLKPKRSDLSFQHFSMEVYSDISPLYLSLSNEVALHKAMGFQYDSARLTDLVGWRGRWLCMQGLNYKKEYTT